jgi:hypothetical protein
MTRRTRRLNAVLGLTLGAALLAPAVALAQHADAPAAGPAHPVPGAHARKSLPSHATWLADTKRALAGANRYLDRQAAKTDPSTLAIVLDIDNTSLQTQYAWPKAVPATLRVARHAADLGMHVFFVTGRLQRGLGTVTPDLTAAGYTYDKVFGRRPGEELVHEKSRHRVRITDKLGLRIVADIGNHTTDLTGPDTGRTYKLPDYGGQLS